MHKLLKIILLTAIFIIFFAVFSFSQEPAYSGEMEAQSLFDIPPRDLINAPSAGTLPRGCFNIAIRVYNNGGLLSSTSIGLSNRFQIGMSYGATGVISDYEANENPSIEFNVKLRLIDESYLLPAFSIGFNSQGYGAYIDDRERYTYKSKGFFGVFSRSFYMRDVAMGGHAGINYSLEYDNDDDKEVTFFVGMDARFAYNIGFLMEYDLAMNDDRSSVGYAKGRGYFNLGLKWMYSENLELEFILSDILQNRHGEDGEDLTVGRELRITYIEYF